MHQAHALRPVSTLELFFEVPDDRPDWPAVGILVDGRDPFVEVAPEWRGFDPASILGAASPLLPVEPAGRRVALRRCSCGEAGCGVIAPVIVASPDRRHVSWTDFRDYTGEFLRPTVDDVLEDEGREWELPDLHFDREQYESEVRRIAADSSWETDRRRTARLVEERLGPMSLAMPPALSPRWVSPAWREDGVSLMFERFDRGEGLAAQQRLLVIASAHADPDEAAADIVDQLLSTPAERWGAAFGRGLR